MKQFPMICAAGALLAAAGLGFAGETYKVDGKESSVRFDSKAPMESFHGETNAVTGFVRFDSNGLENLHVRIEVDLTKLSTGIKLRDRHMRENHLHTDEYPKAVFESRALAKESAAMLNAEGTTALLLAGTFTMHGVKREMTIPVDVRRPVAAENAADKEPMSHIEVASVFTIELDAFEIPRPKFLVLKLDETQKITIRLRLVEDAS